MVSSEQPGGEYLSIKQAAALVGLSPTKVRREVKAGRLRATNSGTVKRSHYRIRKADLESWLETNMGEGNLPPKSVMTDLVNRYFRSDD